MNIRTIIQARLGSTRLPNKVIAELIGTENSISIMDSRIKNPVWCFPDTETQMWLKLFEFKQYNRILRDDDYYFGSEQDVLSRYHQSIDFLDLDHIVRVTSDCPIINQDVIDILVKNHLKHGNDFTYYTGDVHGLNCEIFTRDALHRSHLGATKPEHREHVSDYILDNFRTFKVGIIGDYELKLDLQKHYRLTLDYKEDLIMLRGVFGELWTPCRPQFTVQEVIDLLERKPWIKEINERWNE